MTPTADTVVKSLTRADRLREARQKAGYRSASAAAAHHQWVVPTYRAHENGFREFDVETAVQYAAAFNCDAAWLHGRPIPSIGVVLDTARPMPNASASREIVQPGGRKINILGARPSKASTSTDHDELIMDGTVIDMIEATPVLANVPGAYALYVMGDTMEPRYYAGDIVEVHPGKPFKGGDYVIAHVRLDGRESPSGFIKQLVSMDDAKLVLRQFNPPDEIEFARSQVEAIHRIVASRTP